jgi:hypothetical protein
MTQEQVDLLVGAIELVCLIVCFLKGRWTVIILAIGAALLSPVAIFGTYWHHIITEPLGWWPLVAIFRLAKPSSMWADWFYNEPKMQLARQRYPTANPVPRSLRKQAIRNIRAMNRGDLSAIQQRLGEQKATTEPPEQAVDFEKPESPSESPRFIASDPQLRQTPTVGVGSVTTKTVLRWVTVIPAAILSTVVVTLIMSVLVVYCHLTAFDLHFPLRELVYLAVSVRVGTWIAPSHKKVTGVVLALLYILSDFFIYLSHPEMQQFHN